IGAKWRTTALLIRISTDPNRSIAAAISLSTSAGSARSVRWWPQATPNPAASSEPSRSQLPSSAMSLIIRLAPAEARARAIAAPSPPAAPVTSAVRPVSLATGHRQFAEQAGVFQAVEREHGLDDPLRGRLVEHAGDVPAELADHLLIRHRIGGRPAIMLLGFLEAGAVAQFDPHHAL